MGFKFDSTSLAIPGAAAKHEPQVKVTPAVERCLAGAALLASSPLLAGTMLAVRLLSGRSPLVALRRIGLQGEPFWLFKIRTMWDRTPTNQSGGWVEYVADMDVPETKDGADPRVTSRFAKLCRRLSLDELPQLLHVAQGTMRIAGPRPLTRLELDTYYGDAAEEILRVLPGITGLWQVMGRNRLTYKQRLRLDRFFVRRGGQRLYFWILLRTFGAIVRGQGAC